MKIRRIIKVEENKAKDEKTKAKCVACGKIVEGLINYLKTGNINNLSEIKKQKENLITIVTSFIESSNELIRKYGSNAQKFTKEAKKINNITDLVNLLMTVFNDIADDKKAFTNSNTAEAVKKTIEQPSAQPNNSTAAVPPPAPNKDELDALQANAGRKTEGQGKKTTEGEKKTRRPLPPTPQKKGTSLELRNNLNNALKEQHKKYYNRENIEESEENTNNNEFENSDDTVGETEQQKKDRMVNNLNDALKNVKSFDEFKESYSSLRISEARAKKIASILEERNVTIDNLKSDIKSLEIDLNEYYHIIEKVKKMPEGINVGTIIEDCKKLRNISVNEYINIFNKLPINLKNSKETLKKNIENLEENAIKFNISLEEYCTNILSVLESSKLSLEQAIKNSQELNVDIHDYCLILKKSQKDGLKLSTIADNAKKLGISLNEYYLKSKTSDSSVYERLRMLNLQHKNVDYIIQDTKELGYGKPLDYIDALEKVQLPPKWDKKNVLKQATKYGFKDNIEGFSKLCAELVLNGFKYMEDLFEKFKENYKEKYKESHNGKEFEGEVPKEKLPTGKDIIKFLREYIKKQEKSSYIEYSPNNLMFSSAISNCENFFDKNKGNDYEEETEEDSGDWE